MILEHTKGGDCCSDHSTTVIPPSGSQEGADALVCNGGITSLG